MRQLLLGRLSVLINPRQIAKLTLTALDSLCLLEISGDFPKSVEIAYSRPSYIQARKGA
jgi:hypothetical protein